MGPIFAPLVWAYRIGYPEIEGSCGPKRMQPAFASVSKRIRSELSDSFRRAPGAFSASKRLRSTQNGRIGVKKVVIYSQTYLLLCRWGCRSWATVRVRLRPGPVWAYGMQPGRSDRLVWAYADRTLPSEPAAGVGLRWTLQGAFVESSDELGMR